jgi:hypothetical protein
MMPSSSRRMYIYNVEVYTDEVKKTEGNILPSTGNNYN